MPTKDLYLNAIEIQSAKNAQLDHNTNEHIFPDEGSIAEMSEFYLQLSAFNLPPSHF